MERCESIKRLPDLRAPHLEKLDICYCENLIKIHDSIGLLNKLKCLFLRDCMKLQSLPSTLKLNKRFILSKCPMVEKFPDVHPEMKCLNGFTVYDSGIRKWPPSLRYLTDGIIRLEIRECENIGKFLDSTNKWGICEERDAANLFKEKKGTLSVSFDGFHIFPDYYEYPTLIFCRENLIDLDVCMKNDFFPALRRVTIEDSNIVSIPEGIYKLSSLEEIYIHKCKELREIQISRLPQSIRHVEIRKCPSLPPQSSSELLNRVRSPSLIIK